jgi:CheY-like chemotaxis protein
MARLDKAFTGLRILVVEDNFLAAEVVRDTLESNGCTVVGPVGRIADGLRLAEQEALDGAVLDVNLNGDWCFPIAEALRRRDVPFIFLTGYDDAAITPPSCGLPAVSASLSSGHTSSRRCQKSFELADLIEARLEGRQHRVRSAGCRQQGEGVRSREGAGGQRRPARLAGTLLEGAAAGAQRAQQGKFSQHDGSRVVIVRSHAVLMPRSVRQLHPATLLYGQQPPHG